MADVANSLTSMDGLFKKVYANNVEKLIPNSSIIANDIDFVPVSQREGDVFAFPVSLTREHGWTLQANSSDPFDKADAISANSKEATVNGSQFHLKSLVSYAAMAKALRSQGASRERAFVMATSHVVENMVDSAAFVRELCLLYGGGVGAAAANVGGIGVISAAPGGTGAGTYTVTVSDATWAAGIWAGMEGALVDVYSTSLANDRGSFKVTAVDIEAKTLDLNGTAATAIAATDVIYLNNGYQNEMAGLKRIITNAGSLFGISAATYNLWKGNSFAAGGAAFTFQKLLTALNKPVGRGLSEEVCAYISVETWSDMLNDLAALRRYASNAGGKLEQGATGLAFYSQNGAVMIKPHIFMKAGEACIIPTKYVHRVGATDITFSLPGGTDKFLQPSETKSAYIMECYWLQGIIIKKPARCVWVTGIVNSTGA